MRRRVAENEAGPADSVVTLFKDVLAQSQYTVPDDAEWFRTLVAAYNSAFRGGQALMWILLSALLVLVSPFAGFGAAMWAFGVSLIRPVVATAGRAITDELGIGHFLRTWTRYVAWQRRVAAAQHQQQAQQGTAQPAVGSAAPPALPLLSVADLVPNFRSNALPEDEIRMPPAGSLGNESLTPEQAAAEQYSNGCYGCAKSLVNAASAPTRWFNTGFSYGHAAATFLLAALTFLAAPFLGMFMAAWQLCYSLVRAMFYRAEGRLLTDLFGLTELLDQKTAFMLEQMAQGQVGSNGASNSGSYGSNGTGPSRTSASRAGLPALATPVPLPSPAASSSQPLLSAPYTPAGVSPAQVVVVGAGGTTVTTGVLVPQAAMVGAPVYPAMPGGGYQ